MKKILHYPSDTKSGVWYYRSKTPYINLTQLTDKYKVNITNKVDWTNPAQLDDIANNYDLVTVHNGLFPTEKQDAFWKALIYLRSKKVKLLLDIDDYWHYGPDHPMDLYCISNAIPQKMMMNFKFFDAITTTTEYLANKIRKETSTPVYVLENGISLLDDQFTTTKKPSNRIRLGLTGGASHINDLNQLMNFPRWLPKDDLDKIQLVFCGFDLTGDKLIYDENGNCTKMEMPKEENWWWTTEQHWLSMLPNESYMRIPTTSIDQGEYGHIYENIDVLLVPLKPNTFNSCKSELKFIEAGFTNTAIVASNTGPYRDYGRDKEDCLLVKECTSKAWAGKIHKIVNDKKLYESLRDNLHSRVVAERNLESITEKRINLFDDLLK